MPFIRLAFVCLFSLFLAVPVEANETEKVPSLEDAKTAFDVFDYMDHELRKTNEETDRKQQAALRADIFMRASDKLLEIAKEENDRSNAYNIRLSAFQSQIIAEVEGAQQKMEAFLDELAAKEETRYRAEGLRFQLFIGDATKTINTPEGVSAFKAGLKSWIYRNIDSANMFIRADRIGRGIRMVVDRGMPRIVEIETLRVVAERSEDAAERLFTELIEDMIAYIQSAECTLSAEEKATAVQSFKHKLQLYQFGLFYRKALETVNTPESFDAFKAELKAWINRKTVNVDTIPQLGLLIAEKNGIPAEQFINELIEFLQSPECKSPYRDHKATEWKKFLFTAFGAELKLYGRTLDDKDFDWESLRGKYVLVQFTATWCGPCHMEIPGMLEAYKKYHDKGFEIISIYIWERGNDPVAAIKEHVEHTKLPWIILSETLAEKARQPRYEESFAIQGVPMMLLVDKEGKIIMTNARGEDLQTKLTEIFE